MIGRREELAAFEAAATAVLDGTGRCVLVTGEAGIGKTRAAAPPLRPAGAATDPRAARPSAAPPDPPGAPAPRRRPRHAADGAEACGPLAPYLAPLRPELGLAALDAGEATLIEALRRAFAELASHGPVAVVLDDLHWADEATLLLLPRIAAGLAETPLL